MNPDPDHPDHPGPHRRRFSNRRVGRSSLACRSNDGSRGECRDETVVVLEDLSTGNADAVHFGELVVGKTGDIDLVSKLIADGGIDTVMYFAAHAIVPESVANPLKYYANNTCSTRNLLQACQDNHVSNFIFSSTAAT